MGAARVVDEDVDGTEFGFDGRDVAGDRRQIGEVPDQGFGNTALPVDRFDSRLRGVSVDIGHRNLGALGGQRPGNRPAQSTASAKHQRRLARNSEIHSSSLRNLLCLRLHQ